MHIYNLGESVCIAGTLSILSTFEVFFMYFESSVV